jgi:hypothetical protein
MGLVDDLDAPVTRRGRPKCSVTILLEKVTPAEADKIREKLAMPLDEYPSTLLAERINGAGYTIDYSALQRHRRGACKCPH